MKLNINRRINNGMWVRLEVDVEKTGILHDIDWQRGVGKVHVVDMDTGTTRYVLPDVSLSALRQAMLDEIPKCRRPDVACARRLGYLPTVAKAGA